MSIEIIRLKLKELVQACQDEGINPSITLWIHEHMQSSDLTEERAVEIAKGVTGKQDLKLDYETLKDVCGGKGMISEYILSNNTQVQIALAYKLPRLTTD